MTTAAEQLQTRICNMPEKIGKSLDESRSLLSKTDLQKQGEIMKLLKGENGVTYGFANTISQLYLKSELLSPKKESTNEADAKLLNGKEGIAEIFMKAKTLFKSINEEVEFSYKNTYISMRTPKKAIRFVATKHKDQSRYWH